jgi:hypothetical protein
MSRLLTCAIIAGLATSPALVRAQEGAPPAVAPEGNVKSGTSPTEAAPAPAAVPVEAPAPVPPLAVHAFLWNTSPVALKTGLVLGGGIEARYRLGEHGLFVGARLAAGEASGATSDWTLTQVHMEASVAGGVEGRFGVGLMHAQLTVGTLGIRQIGKRQQYDRLATDNIEGLERDGWSWGPVVTLEVGAAVVFFDPWRVFLEIGPGFTVQNVEGSKVGRFLLSSALGVGYAF